MTATLIAAVLFGAISGSSTAMAAAMSVIAYPELIKRGYPKWMAACSVDASGCSRGVVWGVFTPTEAGAAAAGFITGH